MATTAWGNVPAWLALVGGSAALFSYASSRLDVRRSPAAAVYIIITKYRFGDPPDEDNLTAYKLVNGGPLPIYDAGVSVWEFGKRRWFWRFRKAPKWMTGDRIEGRVHVNIEPGGSAEGTDMTAPQYPTPKHSRLSMTPPVMVMFRDGHGREWVRWPDGRLNRVRLVRW